MRHSSARPRIVRNAPVSSIRASGSPADGVPSDSGDIVDLALGEPSWSMPGVAQTAPAMVETAGYGPHAGLDTLRREIAEYEEAATDEVLVTAGAQAALFAVVQTYLGPGDAALVPDPGFPAYRALTELAGACAVPYPLAESRQELDAEALIDVLDQAPDARLVFVNHPSNPAGGTATVEALRRVAEACGERGVLLLSDEVYRELHDGIHPPSLREVSHSGLAVGSVSKAWAAPGLRVGWLVGDPSLLEPCRSMHALMTTHAGTTSQAAARDLLRMRDEALPESRRQLEFRRRTLAEAWRRATGSEPNLPRTGLYHWFDVRDDVDFCRRARTAGVALVPGSAFGRRGRGWVRLSLGAPPEAIQRGVARLTGLFPEAERRAA